MELYKNSKTFYAKDAFAWRNWLKLNCENEKAVWLIIYHKASKTPSINYNQAVDEALCFGWIDSVPNKRDGESSYTYFSKRNPKSNWSKVNKDKVAKLLADNKMAPQGLAMIDLAKETGTWTALDKVENLELPIELQKLFIENKVAFLNWENFAKSAKRGILEWIYNAKKEATKIKRIEETVRLAELNLRANFKGG